VEMVLSLEGHGNDFESTNDLFYDRNWTDGLPIVPPTETRVEAMLAATSAARDRSIGKFPPRWREATVEYLAVNAVMAGCRPEHFPVVLAAIDAMLDPTFNLYAVQATTNPCGPMLVVNGPLAHELDINAGFNIFGPGWRANATIGRAVRLAMINIGGAIPGIGDMATLGNPAKYTACFAENEAASPWEPLHVERGFAESDSVVTVIAAVAPQNVIVISHEAAEVLKGLALGFQISGGNCERHTMQIATVLSPVHAKNLVDGGFDKAAARQFLWEHSKISREHFSEPDLYAVRGWKEKCIHVENGREVMYVTETPDDIALIVAGGAVGHHSAIIPAFDNTKLVSRRIDDYR
jgi:hypothetical protein